MSATLHATFDGKVLRPEEPLTLPANTRVRLIIELVEPHEAEERPQSFLKTARSLHLEGPPDWSSHLEDYLYPEPSRQDE